MIKLVYVKKDEYEEAIKQVSTARNHPGYHYNALMNDELECLRT